MIILSRFRFAANCPDRWCSRPNANWYPARRKICVQVDSYTVRHILVSRTLQRTVGRWVVWTNQHQVCLGFNVLRLARLLIFGAEADLPRPKRGTPHPLGKITNSSKTLHQLEKALDEAQPVLLSDWSHFTSEELTQVAEDANIDQL